jgi:hypothetical protein
MSAIHDLGRRHDDRRPGTCEILVGAMMLRQRRRLRGGETSALRPDIHWEGAGRSLDGPGNAVRDC